MLTYLLLLPVVEHRLLTRVLQPTLSRVLISNCFKMLFTILMSTSDSRRNVYFSLHISYFPSGFQVIPCFVMQFKGFLNVYPIQKCILPKHYIWKHFALFSGIIKTIQKHWGNNQNKCKTTFEKIDFLQHHFSWLMFKFTNNIGF